MKRPLLMRLGLSSLVISRPVCWGLSEGSVAELTHGQFANCPSISTDGFFDGVR